MTTRTDDVAGLVSFASRVLAGSDALAAVAPRLAGQDPGEQALGSDAPGKLGDLCRQLHSQLAGALAARGDEALAHSDRMLRTAMDLGRIAADYADVDITLSSKVKKTGEDSMPDLPAGDGRDVVVEAG